MFNHYLITSFRNLLRNKFQTLFTILGLSVAFLCFGVCMYFVHGYLSIDHYFAKHERVLELTQNDYSVGFKNASLSEFQQRFPEVETIFRMHQEKNTFYSETLGENVELLTISCDTSLNYVYGPKLLAGSWQAAEQGTNSMVMTESWAKRLYGSPEKAIGEQLHTMGGRSYSATVFDCPNYTVQAVIEDLPYNNTILPFSSPAAWLMNDTDGPLLSSREEIYFIEPRILLREGIDAQQFIEQLKNAKAICGYYQEARSEKVAPYYYTAKYPFDPINTFGQYSFFLFFLLIIATPGLLILLSALSNFFHLLLSNIMMRRREYALRRAHGAHTWQLWLMVSTQVIIMLLLVGFAALIIVKICAPLLEFDMGKLYRMVFDVDTMMKQSAAHLGVLLLIGLLVSWLAVARIRKDSLQESMKTTTGRRPGRHIGRNILMGWQMTIGFLFMTVLAALLLQIRTNETARLPWLSAEEKKHIVEIPFMAVQPEQRDAIDAQLRTIPSIQEVVFKYNSLLITNHSLLRITGPQGDTTEVISSSTHSSVLKFINTPLLQGRWPENSSEIVVDQNFIDHHSYGVGAQIVLLEDNMTQQYNEEGELISNLNIVGVIDNVVEKSTENNGGKYIRRWGGIYLNRLDRNGFFACKAYPGKTKEMRKAINDLGLFEQNLELPSIYDDIREQNSAEREFVALGWLFAAIALIITMLGIYSAITMDTTARRKEMAIRKINGAKSHHIALRFVRLYAVLMGISAAIAFPATWLLFNWIGEQGYREHFNFGFLFYTCIFLLMALFVALTIGVQIWRIARINPAKVVKSE